MLTLLLPLIYLRLHPAKEMVNQAGLERAHKSLIFLDMLYTANTAQHLYKRCNVNNKSLRPRTVD